MLILSYVSEFSSWQCYGPSKFPWVDVLVVNCSVLMKSVASLSWETRKTVLASFLVCHHFSTIYFVTQCTDMLLPCGPRILFFKWWKRNCWMSFLKILHHFPLPCIDRFHSCLPGWIPERVELCCPEGHEVQQRQHFSHGVGGGYHPQREWVPMGCSCCILVFDQS